MVGREQVLGYRARVQGLERGPRPERGPHALDAVLRLGLQDTPHGSAAAALAIRRDGRARGAPEPAAPDLDGLAVLWSWRGAPYLHRREDAAFLAAALWPVDDADATRRIGSGQIADGARRGLAAFTDAATALREVVTGRLPKGEVSARVSAQVPADLTYDCPGCAARHISGGLFQQVGVAAGVELRTEHRTTSLEPLPAGARPDAVPARAEGTPAALLRYLKVLGPATPAHLAAFLGATPGVVRAARPEGVVEVRITGGGTGWIAQPDLERVLAATRPRLTRLLPPADPWLQGRDRDLLVPDPARRRAIWRPIGSPGVLLVDGEAAGTWRARAQGKRLAVTVEPFAPLTRAVRSELAPEGDLLAAARGLDGCEVAVS